MTYYTQYLCGLGRWALSPLLLKKTMEEIKKTYDFEQGLQEILEQVGSYYPEFGPKQAERITQAFAFGQKAHKGQLRYSGYPYFRHCVEATKLLLAIKPDVDTVVACLLHDVLDDTMVLPEEIEASFGAKVRQLCEGISQVSRVQLQKEQRQEKELEKLQKLFVAFASDIRVIFIKLADRIQNLQTLEHIPSHKRKRIARESFEVYAPIAEKFGLFEFKKQIEDLAFRWLHPRIFQKLEKEFQEHRTSQQAFLARAKYDIAQLLREHGMEVMNIEGREKHLTSVYQKMQRKGLSSVHEVYDLFAIKIILQDSADCYQALGLIHAHWKPMAQRFKDFIAVPKPNGYQSLHTTILGLAKSQLPTEIQIKTQQMDLDAEFGPAAHWAYKKALRSDFDEDYMRRMSWISGNFSFKGLDSHEDFFEAISQSLLEDHLYVFSPGGDIFNLPVGSVPVDFAYAIHSDIGDSCIGARINGVIKPLDYKLQTGDVVEILTKKGRTPNPHWLSFVKSSHAKNRIQRALRKDEPAVKPLLKKTKGQPHLKTTPSKTPPVVLEGKQKSPYNILIGGEEGLAYRLSKCCSPAPGKDIMAYNSRGLEFVIHQVNCDETQDLDPDRFYEAHFILKKKFSVLVGDRKGMLKELSEIIAREGGFIWDYRQKRKPHNTCDCTFEVHVTSDKEYKAILQLMKRVSDVKEVQELA